MPDALAVILLAANTVILCVTLLACAWAKMHAQVARAGGLLACNERHRAEKAADRAIMAAILYPAESPATLPFPAPKTDPPAPPTEPDTPATLPFAPPAPALRLCCPEDGERGEFRGAD